MEAKLCSVGANCREKTVKMPAKSEAEGKVVPMEEAVDCSLDNKGIKEATVVKDVQISELEGSCVMCEFGGEQLAARVKAPSQKIRAVIRAEPAETQDYVSGLQALEELGPEEIEELRFVPSALSEAQWASHMCDNKCREEGFKFFQLAATATEQGGAAHTINLCKQCYHERRLKQSEQPVKAVRWREN